MQKFKMQAIRLVELVNVIDSTPAKDLVTIKDVRLNVNLVEDLKKANSVLSTKVDDFNVSRETIVKPYKKEFEERSVGLTDEEKHELEKEVDKKLQTEQKETLEGLKPVTDEIERLSKEEVEVELSDDKFAKLKEWVEKAGALRFSNKKIFIEVCDALKIE